MVSSSTASLNSTLISSTTPSSTSLGGQSVNTALSNATAKPGNNSLPSLSPHVLAVLDEQLIAASSAISPWSIMLFLFPLLFLH